MAPIDIVIDVIKRHKCDAEEHKNDVGISYYQGKIDAYNDLLSEFEDFKRLFS